MREKCTGDMILHVMFQVSDRTELAILSISHSIEMPAQGEMLGEKFMLSVLLISLFPQEVKGICQHSTRKCTLHLQSSHQSGPWMIEAISQQDIPFIFELSNNSTLQQLRINNGQSYPNKDSIVHIFPSAIKHCPPYLQFSCHQYCMNVILCCQMLSCLQIPHQGFKQFVCHFLCPQISFFKKCN